MHELIIVVVGMDTPVEITYICKHVYAIYPCPSLLGRALGRAGESQASHQDTCQACSGISILMVDHVMGLLSKATISQ